MKGTVTNESSRQANTRFGVKTTYSIEVDGVWYKCGFKKPPCKVGDEVEFNENTSAYGMEAKDIRPIGTRAPSGEDTPVKTQPKASYNSRPEKTFPVPPLHGDRSIIRQNSLAHATQLVVFQIREMGTTVSLDDMARMVIELASKFEEYSAGDIERHAADNMVQEAKVK